MPSWREELRLEFLLPPIHNELETPLLELLSVSDACVTGFQDVAVEAMILERPVICMNLPGKPDMPPYAEGGAALGVGQSQEIGPAFGNTIPSGIACPL